MFCMNECLCERVGFLGAGAAMWLLGIKHKSSGTRASALKTELLLQLKSQPYLKPKQKCLVSVCVCCTCHSLRMEVKEQFVGIIFLFLLYRSWDFNSGYQFWWQILLPAESSYQPQINPWKINEVNNKLTKKSHNRNKSRKSKWQNPVSNLD